MALLEARDAGHSWLGRSLPHGDRGSHPQQRLQLFRLTTAADVLISGHRAKTEHNKMKVYTAHLVTESLDHYVWVYRNRPSKEQLIRRLMEIEGAAENDFDFYEQTTSIRSIEETDLIEEE